MKPNQTKWTSMFSVRCWMLNVAVLVTAGTALATVRYVDVNSTNATPPYTNWTTAATNIQDAVDAAVAGDEIVVTNGIYAPVYVGKPLAIQSINGPDVTTVDGGGSRPCVYLTTNASLSGFTLTNGYSPLGGGGAFGGTLNNCMLTRNSAPDPDNGGGGGAAYCTLNNCTLTGNSASGGGGAYACTLNNCFLTGNSASYYGSGGGAYGCTLNNCTLTGNMGSAGWYSGGVGGVDGDQSLPCTLKNCIVYFNTGGNYGSYCTLDYCCTTGLPAGVGNISADPQLASTSHLSAFSPCIGRGNYAAASGVDIDGQTWANPPSIGCDEYHAGSVTGPLAVGITASFTNVAVGYPVDFTALIEGATDLSAWDFGDGTLKIDQPYAAHSWATPGDYLVSLWAFNDSYPGGISATVTVHIGTGVNYVAANSANPVAPYTSWATAATNIQDAITAAEPGATVVVVSNGSYGPINIPAFMTVRSVNGPQLTTINGGGRSRCANLATSATLSGFTLTNGLGQYSSVSGAYGGGGAYGGTLNNCALTGNRANGHYECQQCYDPQCGCWRACNCDYVGGGGGASSCTLNNCTLSGNSADRDGGGAHSCTLYNCTLTANSATNSGGGAYSCTLNNCTLTGNRAAYGGGAESGSLNNCTLIGNCASFGGGAYSNTLSNCTLTGNSASGGGGGATSCALNNCTLAGNSGSWGGGADACALNNCALSGNSASDGGGASYGTLNNCTLTWNWATNSGGGAYSSTLNNCALTGNSAGSAGGVAYGTLHNCIVYFNTATNGANYDAYSTLSYSCTSPQPTNGFGNITNAPLFVDQASGNLRLQSNSPCINAGKDAYVIGNTDLDGNPRIAGGTVDMGAYEFQSPVSQTSYAWLQQYGLPINSSTDSADPDGDAVDNYHEWLAGTDPTNPFSSPAQLTIIPSGVPPSGIILTWSTNAVGFTLQSTTNLISPSVWSTNSPAPVVIAGRNVVTNPITGPQQFYRLAQ